MNKNQNWLDPKEKHTLTEQECEMINLLRSFTLNQRKMIFDDLIFAVMEKSTLSYVKWSM